MTSSVKAITGALVAVFLGGFMAALGSLLLYKLGLLHDDWAAVIVVLVSSIVGLIAFKAIESDV